jgi:uroporphyrinogen decarboxylase
MTGRFLRALAGEPQSVPPVWCMRQAGRYQRAYQGFRRRHSFEALCREPELAARVALAAVADFDFDAAILFSDLLFPLNALGLPLHYDESGPHIGRRLTPASKLRPVDRAARDLMFQAEAVAATRRQLPTDKGMIGFVGGPWTLFVYAVEGSHTGALATAKQSLGLYKRFARSIVALLERNARAQLEAGADVVMVFDTAAGELAPGAYRDHVAPDLERLANALPGRLGYFARGVQAAHFGGALTPPGAWLGTGYDWRWNLTDPLIAPARRGFIQGNFDPALLHATGAALGRAIDEFLTPLDALTPEARRGWICGLGHGVLPKTPEASVRTFVRTVRRRFA